MKKLLKRIGWLEKLVSFLFLAMCVSVLSVFAELNVVGPIVTENLTATIRVTTPLVCDPDGNCASPGSINLNESDPIYSAWDKHTGISITESQISDLQDYLTSYTEIDPIFGTSAASGINATNIGNWNTAFGWGDHASAGYLTSFTELDPLYSAAPAFGITATNIGNWNTAYGWGDHAAEGYLRNETDPQVGAVPLNYVPKSDGNILVQGSIFDNGNIGIGTTTPQADLEVNNIIRLTPYVGDLPPCDATIEGSIVYYDPNNRFYGCGGSPLQWRSLTSGPVQQMSSISPGSTEIIGVTTGEDISDSIRNTDQTGEAP